MHSLLIERFRSGNPIPIYARLHTYGRLAPTGLIYVSSRVTKDLKTCYQVTDTEDRDLLDGWIKNWEDLVEFEALEIVISIEGEGEGREPGRGGKARIVLREI